MNSLRLRPARPADAPAILQLIREAVESIPDYSPRLRRLFLRKYRLAIVTKRLRDRAASCILGMAHGEIVGFTWGMPLRATDDGVYWLNWIGVSASTRRHGVARRMLAELERQLKRHRFHKIWLNIDPKNARSAKTFLALGYHLIARVKHHWYGHDAMLWEKDLQPTKRGI